MYILRMKFTEVKNRLMEKYRYLFEHFYEIRTIK